MEGPPGPPREGRPPASAPALRGRPPARRAPDGGGGGRLPRLLEASHHRRDAGAPPPAGGGIRPARADRRHVPGREDQHDGGASGLARRPARPERDVDRRRRRERGGPGPRRARPDDRLRQSGPERRVEGTHRQAHAQRSVGRRARQGAGRAHRSGAREQGRANARSRQLDERPDPSRPEAESEPMMTLGFDHPLYVLPFDHRGSFQTRMFGWKGRLTSEQTGEIAAAKRVIYDGFTAAVAAGVPRDKGGILVDEQFGASILRDAEAHGYVTACPAEKSGQEEFDFEYGEYFTDHIEVVRPTFCKVLVRYNPQGDPALNRRQADRLKRLSWYLRNKSRSRFMFELLVPAEQGQLDRLGGDTKAYDLELRPRLMVQAIQQLQDAQIEPDIWKVEGLDRLEDCERVVATARRGGRDTVGCIVLGRGEDAKKVRDWLAAAAGVPGFIGFAVGRTVFWDPLVAWRAKKTTREAAVAEVARPYKEVVGLFGRARGGGLGRTEGQLGSGEV